MLGEVAAIFTAPPKPLERGFVMAIHYKGDILVRLKEKGYTTHKLREEKIFGEKTMQDFRTRAEIPYKTINKLCAMLGCGVGDVIEYIPDE